MSIRAILAYTDGDGRWRGVWNHWNGHTNDLGKALIERVHSLGGDLTKFCTTYIDQCPGGWSDFIRGERGEQGGVWSGSFAGETVAFERGAYPDDAGLEPTTQLPDAHFLYLFDLPRRRLLVFEVGDGDCEVFAECWFDETGKASPPELKPTDVEPHEDRAARADVSPTEAELLAAARKVLGDRTFEINASDQSELELYVIVRAAVSPSGLDEIFVEQARSHGIAAEAGDELLLPVYYLRHDEDHADHQRITGLAALFNLPDNAFSALRAALGGT